MYRNAERDRGKKVRGINSAIKKRGDKGKVSLYTVRRKKRDIQGRSNGRIVMGRVNNIEQKSSI